MSAVAATPLTTHRIVGIGEVGEAGDRFDRLRAAHRIVRVEEPERSYWMVLDFELTRRLLQDSANLSSAVTTPLRPEPLIKMIPIQLDPPEHTAWRRLLGPYFSPATMAKLRGKLEVLAESLISDIALRGSCDYVEDFARVYPTTTFLELMGLPVERLPEFLEWEDMMQSAPSPTGVFDPKRQVAGQNKVVAYFTEEIERRRATTDRPVGLLSTMIDWELDGQPISTEALVNCNLLLFLAGLDTVTASLSLMMYHLASRPDDRRLVAELAANGEPLDAVSEELLRYYAVAEIGRKVVARVELDDAVLEPGDLVLFPLVSANRDDVLVQGAQTVSYDRGLVPPHLTFGAGPHRCLGSHLARVEIAVALSVWHRLIPDYEAVKTPLGYWGNVHGLFSLDLGRFDGSSA